MENERPLAAAIGARLRVWSSAAELEAGCSGDVPSPRLIGMRSPAR